ncbi:DNA repair protein RadC [Bengtsoniella intestinalis]|uniref:JAB domain-containing protein n=1 Tax=Bengtsoniella intestinalis TaxID=3073143 RepID=UPI00391F59DD
MRVHDGHREKMRERFRSGGIDHFADHEVLELMLYYAIPRINTNEIAHRLIDRYGTLADVLEAPVEDLEQVEGIGRGAATFLHLVPSVVRKAKMDQSSRELAMTSTEAAGTYLLECFAIEKVEVIYMLCIDRKGKLIACKRLGDGGMKSVDINVRKLMEYALLTGATGVILSHNHPSGVALPSEDDYIATAMVYNALDTIGVTLMDHIIVADGDFVSMADSGYLRDL